MKKRGCVTAAALLALCNTSLCASELNQIIVTATRSAQTEDETLASVSVVTREDIERKQAQSVQDALRGVPGLTISNNGGAGKSTSLFLRGTESDHVLVLVDGIKVGSASLGTTSFQDIPIAQVERIEIVRGPRSSLYGSEALGGVIQIFTRRGGGPLKTGFSLDLGSHNSRGGSADLFGGGDRAWYSLNFALTDTDGINACRSNLSAGCYTDEPDKDGYRNGSGSLRVGYRFDNGLEIDAHALRADGESDFDGTYVNESETSQRVVGTSLRYSPLDDWQISLTGGRSWDRSKNFHEGDFRSRFDTERDQLSLQNDINLQLDHLVTLGLDYQRERLDSTTDYTISDQTNRGAFMQYQGNLSGHDVQLSLRRDHHQEFGDHTTGGLAWGHALGDGLRLTASYGTAFKAPTFNELYWPDYGNAELRPEESESFELGLKGKADRVDWSLNLYQTWIDELIGFDATYKPANIELARIQGIETLFATQAGAWRIDGSLSLLDPRNRSGDSNDGNLLPRRPRHSLRLDLDREFGAYRLGVGLTAEGKRYDDLANTRELGGFASLDLRAEYRINNAWRLQGRCENLFDQQYETASYYNQPARGFFLTLRYQS